MNQGRRRLQQLCGLTLVLSGLVACGSDGARELPRTRGDEGESISGSGGDDPGSHDGSDETVGGSGGDTPRGGVGGELAGGAGGAPANGGVAGELRGGTGGGPGGNGTGGSSGSATGGSGTGGSSGSATGGSGTGGISSAGGAGIGGSQDPKGGETSVGGAPTPALEVIDVGPGDRARTVEPTASVALRFSAPLAPATVTNDSVQLSDGAARVSGRVSSSGALATLAPASRLSLLASYDVRATTAIEDEAGRSLKSAFTSTFTVREGIWGQQGSFVDDQPGWGGMQDVGVDDEGNVLAVSMTAEPTGVGEAKRCFARRYDANGGWQPAVLLGDETGRCIYPKIAVSPAGDAIVAWLSGTDQRRTIRAQRYTRASGWETTSQTLSDLTGPHSGQQLAVAIGGGQVLVSWVELDSSVSGKRDFRLRSAVAAPSGSWPATPVTNLSMTAAGVGAPVGLFQPMAALDSDGNALVAFLFNAEGEAPQRAYYYARKSRGADTWVNPAPIVAVADTYTQSAFASDGDGAMFVYTHCDGESDFTTDRCHLYASRYTKTEQFSTPVDIGGSPHYGIDLDFNWRRHVLASNGREFFTAWRASGHNQSAAYVSHYDITNSRWDSLPVTVSPPDALVSQGDVNVGVDGHGNALVTFAASGSIMVARYAASSGTWAAAQTMTQPDNSYSRPLVSVAKNGTGVLLFEAGIYKAYETIGRLGGLVRFFG